MVRLSIGLLAWLVVFGVGWGLVQVESFGRAAAFSWVSGACFGFILQRSRFCFFCNIRDFVEKREAGGALALLMALAVGIVGYHVVTGAWIVDPSAGHLPPKAHIGPVGWHLVAGGFLFGLGTALSGSCISAHFYRLGEGALGCLLALGGAGLGFIAGSALWNPLYLNFIVGRPAHWLPAWVGFSGSLLLELGVIAIASILIWKFAKASSHGNVPQSDERRLRTLWDRVFVKRWPGWVGGLAVGLLSAVVLLRAEPLGVTSELSRLSRLAGEAVGVVPERLEGIDRMRGCASRPQDGILTAGALFVMGIVAASFASAWTSGEFEWEVPTLRAATGGLAGGFLLGLGAMWSLGCTVGTLLSGIHASAVSGWIFLAAFLPGLLAGLPARRWLMRPAK